MTAAIGIGILLLPLFSFAEEGSGVSGTVSVTVRTVDNERESAKFEEYREIPDGVSGDVMLKYRRDDGYFLDLKAKDIAEDDQYLRFGAGRYGKYRIELIYDKIPHRFAFGAKTLFSGVGSGNLVLGDALQQSLQNVGTDNVGDLDGNGTPNQTADRNIALANRLRDFFAGASSVDLELFRKTGRVNADVTALDPFNFRVEFSKEEREGTRPFFGSFGFGNTVELAEPIDYDTTQLKLIAEYTKKPIYLNATYYLSIFENNISTLTWDNPFRAVDSTTPTAYTTTFAAGPSRGLIDLYPDNKYHNIALTASIADLPLKSRLSATASWGWMRQDENLVPFTTNTAITTGALDGLGGTVPFDTSDPANLPARNVDAKVDTTLVNVLLTSRPMNFMHVKARYRFYEYDNDTGLIAFPGHVRTDAVWEPHVDENLQPILEVNVPTGFKKHTAGIDLGFDVFKASRLTLGYTFEKTKRENREVESQNDNIYKVSFDTSPLSWLDLKASYERAARRGHYDFLIPFIATHISAEEVEAIEAGAPVAQLPFLRKYDEANRDRDTIQFLATVYPIEPLTITGHVLYGKDDFIESPFGLLDDKRSLYAIDADFALTDRLNLYAFYSFEKFKNRQKARQWTPTTGCIIDGDTTAGECTDPFTAVTGIDSPSNWDVENEDKIHTFGGGLKISVMPKKLDLDLSYIYSKADGKIKISSPVGENNDVDPNNFIPLDFTNVDDSRLMTLHAKLKYRLKKGISITLGYLWEKFKVDDFSIDGFTNIPTTSTGAYNAALLMGTLWKDYSVNVVYTKLTYRF